MTFAHADHTAKNESNRYPWYWIDQICINQNDEAEKIIQIGLMTAIYTRSQETIVWVGSGNEKDTEKLAWLALDPRDLPSSYTIGELALSSRTQEMALLRAGVVNFTRRGAYLGHPGGRSLPEEAPRHIWQFDTELDKDSGSNYIFETADMVQ
jgi:hypothetical protein